MKEYLLIGGPADGKRVKLSAEHPPPDVRIAVRSPFRSTVANEALELCEVLPFRAETYRGMVLWRAPSEDPIAAIAYVHESVENPIAALIEGYRRPRKPE